MQRAILLELMSGAYSSGVPFYHSGSRIPDDAHKLQQQQLRCAKGESNEAVFDGNGNDFNYSNTDIGYRNTSYTYPDDTEDDEVKQGDDDDEGDAMPEEFYQKVETFLSKGPPRLKKAKSASGPTLLASVSSRPTAANIPKSATASTTGEGLCSNPVCLLLRLELSSYPLYF